MQSNAKLLERKRLARQLALLAAAQDAHYPCSEESFWLGCTCQACTETQDAVNEFITALHEGNETERINAMQPDYQSIHADHWGDWGFYER